MERKLGVIPLAENESGERTLDNTHKWIWRTVNAAEKAIKIAERHGVRVRLNATGDGLALEARRAAIPPP